MIKPRYQVSLAAIDLIKRFEGYHRRAVQSPDGRWTIGHGHTQTAREGAVVSEDDAEALLIYDLRQVAAAIEQAVFTPLTQNQFDALASFVFNIGIENFRHSTVLRRVNQGDLLGAAFALDIWRKADFEGERIVVDALVRRRAAEKALFLTPQGGWIPAPSPIIEPKADDDPVVRAEDASPPAGFEADDLSPVQRAAANLAIRLRALAPDEAPTRPIEAATDGSAPFPDIAAPEPVSASEPGVEAPLFAPSDSSPPVGSDVEAMRRTIFGMPEPEPKSKPRPRPRPRSGEYGPLVLLGTAGLVAFIGAVIWALHAKPTGEALNIAVVALGSIGILCVASAVYFLLEKLAGRDD